MAHPVLPVLLVDRQKILANIQQVMSWAQRKNVNLFGVTKCLGGCLELAELFIESGFYGLADSRLQNLRVLRQKKPDAPLMYLRLPAVSEAREIVENTDICIVTEVLAVQALSFAAVAEKKELQMLIMVEMGDRREGVMPDSLPALCEAILAAPGLTLLGLAANYACISGSLPSQNLLREFVSMAEGLEKKYSIRLPHLSGGNSALLPLLREEEWPARINFLRVAHDVLLGIDGTNYRLIPELEQGAFTIQAELVECQIKPSVPGGECGLDAWGRKPHILDRGVHARGLVNLGRVDVVPESLLLKDTRLSIIGASSDLMVLDMSKASEYKVGDTIEFLPRYSSVVQAWHSPYLRKKFV